MLTDRVSNPGPLTYESGALPIALRGPASEDGIMAVILCKLYDDALYFVEAYENILGSSKFQFSY